MKRSIQIVKFMGLSEKLRSYGGANMAIEVSSLVKYIRKSLLSYFRKKKTLKTWIWSHRDL